MTTSNIICLAFGWMLIALLLVLALASAASICRPRPTWNNPDHIAARDALVFKPRQHTAADRDRANLMLSNIERNLNQTRKDSQP